MRRFLPPHRIVNFYKTDYENPECRRRAAKQYKEVYSDHPDVSIVIPAYNEETTIVQTLTSLCFNESRYKVEIIVVNNNSRDQTEKYINDCGVKCLKETHQGIDFARTAGLQAAKGRFILNADADTVYPKYWIDKMVAPLEKAGIAITYGQFSFLPTGKAGRVAYFLYEHIADASRFLNRWIKDETVNVCGCSSCLRREQGLSVGGFLHPKNNGSAEDGWMALKLREKGYGKIHHVTSKKAIVWTTDRRIQCDGGLWPAAKKRFKKNFDQIINNGLSVFYRAARSTNR